MNAAGVGTGVREFSLEPAVIQEWNDEDTLRGVLSDEVIEDASVDDLADILGSVRITLPAAPNTQDLVAYASDRATELDLAIKADGKRYDYRLVEVPLNIVVPPPDKLVRLRLRLDFESDGDAPTVAYDVFPPDKWDVAEIDLGQIDIDVSKALQFVEGTPLAPLADALGFKLKVPLRWTTTSALIASSDRNANPAEWYVQDQQIGSEFAPLLIIRSPRHARVTVRATLVGEVRRSLVARILKGQFRSHYGSAATFAV